MSGAGYLANMRLCKFCGIRLNPKKSFKKVEDQLFEATRVAIQKVTQSHQVEDCQTSYLKYCQMNRGSPLPKALYETGVSLFKRIGYRLGKKAQTNVTEAFESLVPRGLGRRIKTYIENRTGIYVLGLVRLSGLHEVVDPFFHENLFRYYQSLHGRNCFESGENIIPGNLNTPVYFTAMYQANGSAYSINETSKNKNPVCRSMFELAIDIGEILKNESNTVVLTSTTVANMLSVNPAELVRFLTFVQTTNPNISNLLERVHLHVQRLTNTEYLSDPASNVRVCAISIVKAIENKIKTQKMNRNIAGYLWSMKQEMGLRLDQSRIGNSHIVPGRRDIVFRYEAPLMSVTDRFECIYGTSK